MQSETALEDNKPTEQELQLSQMVKRGATVEDIAEIKESRANTPAAAIRALKTGNARFFSGLRYNTDLSPVERRAQTLAQTPFAIVLGCSDSRVPIEIVYAQRAGDIFAIRIAGNVVETSTLASIEYAVKHLKSHVVVVMGHEGCGAVQVAMLDEATRRAEPHNVQLLLERIAPSVNNLPRIRDYKARMREAVIANFRQQVHNLKQNPVVVEALEKQQIAVIGAFYELSSGAVDFFETEEELRLDDEEFYAT